MSIHHLQVSVSHWNLSITVQGTDDYASHQMLEARMKSLALLLLVASQNCFSKASSNGWGASLDFGRLPKPCCCQFQENFCLRRLLEMSVGGSDCSWEGFDSDVVGLSGCWEAKVNLLDGKNLHLVEYIL